MTTTLPSWSSVLAFLKARNSPIDGEPADVVAVANDYGSWLAESDVPKLFINAEPGFAVRGRIRELIRTWPNLTETTVTGIHLIQEDSPDQIGIAVANFVRTLREPQPPEGLGLSSTSPRTVRRGVRVAYDEDLANRIREILGPERGIEEKQMFGGLAFLINGNVSVMCLGASGQGGLMVRVRPDDTEKLLQREHVSVKVMAGREPRGWLHVATDGLKTKRQLQSWVTRGVEYAKTLRPKQARGRRSRD